MLLTAPRHAVERRVHAECVEQESRMRIENDEARMTNDERSPNSQFGGSDVHDSDSLLGFLFLLSPV